MRTSLIGGVTVLFLAVVRVCTAQWEVTLTASDDLNGGADLGTIANIGTSLRTPAEQTVYYLMEESPGLGGQEYALADLAGTADAGGMLAPLLPGGFLLQIR